VIRALLVDDEPLARARLRQLLGAHPRVIVVGEAHDVPSAREAYRLLAPIQLVFLDLEMPGARGFTLLPDLACPVVLVTAHAEYAVQAFTAGANDYLLKPVAPDRLSLSLERLFGPNTHRFAVRDGAQTHFIDAGDIRRAAGAGDYTELYLADGRVLLSDERLRTWEQKLGSPFVRIHRSHLVAISTVRHVRRDASTRSYSVLLAGGQELPVSRRRLAQVRKATEG